jgi:hypothetical protein
MQLGACLGVDMRRGIAFTVACAFVTSISGIASAQTCTHYGGYTHWAGNLDFYFQESSQIVDLAISGNTAYCLVKLPTGEGMVRVLNIENLSIPVILGSVTWPNGQPGSLVLSAAKVYVTEGALGLRIVNVANPASPTLLGQVVAPGAITNDVAVSGSFAFLADANQGLHIVDVSDPQNPTIIGGVDTPGNATGIAVLGTRAYIADYALSGLQIVDVSNPNAPAIVGSIVTPGSAVNVTLSGSLAYVSDGEQGVQIINVLDPGSPAIVANIPAPPGSQVSDVTIMGPLAFLASGNEGVHEYDVSDPAVPAFVQRVLTRGPTVRVLHSEGSRIFASYQLSPFRRGFDAFYISPPQDPPILGSLSMQYVSSMATSGSTACLVDYSGLNVVDVSDPASPQLQGHLVTEANDVALSGSVAYVAAGAEGFKIVDVSDPQQPSVIATVPDTTGYGVAAVQVSGSMAYVGYYLAGLRIFDVSDPFQPVGVATLSIPCSRMAVSGSRAYFGYGNQIVVMDVSDPALPQQLGFVYTPSLIRDITEDGSVLYLGMHSGLGVVDASDPTDPVFVTEMPMMEATVFHVAVSGSFLYMATGSWVAGLVIVDITQPSVPRVIGNIEGLAFSVATSGDVVYVGGDEFLIVPIQCLATAGVTPGSSIRSAMLGAARPNPTRDASVIPFAVSKSGMVTLRVYDLAGREVRTLVNEPMQEGSHTAIWDGRNGWGVPVTAGIYFFHLSSPGFTASQKLVRIR